MRHRRTIFAVSLVAAAAVILAGGLFASNMGFKLNYPLKASDGGTLSKSGNNTIALPYNRQVGIDNARQLYLDIANVGNVQNIQKFLPDSDGFSLYSSTSTGNNFLLEAGVGLFVKMGGDLDYIVVGSHDPSAEVQLNKAGTSGSKSGNNLYAPPYHTTVSNAKELYAEITGVQNIQRFLPASDTTSLYSSTSTGDNFPIVPGEAYFVKMGSDLSYTPSHY